MLKNKSLLAGALLASAFYGSQAFAAAAHFEDPATASWGGWNRGDAGTLYTLYETWVSDPGSPNDLFNDFIPDATNGTTFNHHITYAASSFAIANDRIYTPTEQASFLTYSVGFGNINPGGPVTVALQLRKLAEDWDLSSIKLDVSGGDENYVNADSVTELFSEPTGGLGGTTTELLFLWTLAGDIGTYAFTYSSLSSSLSFDTFSLDVGPSAVPVPAAVWMFGSALIGLIGVGRQRRTVTEA